MAAQDASYEAAKIAAIREVKDRISEEDARDGGFGYGFLEGFRAGWPVCSRGLCSQASRRRRAATDSAARAIDKDGCLDGGRDSESRSYKRPTTI